MIKQIKKYGKSAQGRSFLIKHLQGKKLTPLQAIAAKCYDCMGYYVDGTVDCGVKDCPLYPFMPYKEKGVKNE